MEVAYWQMLAGVSTTTTILAVAVLGSVIFADRATYRRGR